MNIPTKEQLERLKEVSSADIDNKEVYCQYCDQPIDSSQDPQCDHDAQTQHTAHLSCCKSMEPEAYNKHTGELLNSTYRA